MYKYYDEDCKLKDMTKFFIEKEEFKTKKIDTIRNNKRECNNMDMDEFIDMFRKCCEKGYIKVGLKKECISNKGGGASMISEITPYIYFEGTPKNKDDKRIYFKRDTFTVCE